MLTHPKVTQQKGKKMKFQEFKSILYAFQEVQETAVGVVLVTNLPLEVWLYQNGHFACQVELSPTSLQ